MIGIRTLHAYVSRTIGRGDDDDDDNDLSQDLVGVRRLSQRPRFPRSVILGTCRERVRNL